MSPLSNWSRNSRVMCDRSDLEIRTMGQRYIGCEDGSRRRLEGGLDRYIPGTTAKEDMTGKTAKENIRGMT